MLLSFKERAEVAIVSAHLRDEIEGQIRAAYREALEAAAQRCEREAEAVGEWAASICMSNAKQIRALKLEGKES